MAAPGTRARSLVLASVLPLVGCRGSPAAARDSTAAACAAGAPFAAESLLGRPDVRAALPDEPWFPGARAHAAALRDSSGTFVVAALGWEGPPAGVVLLFSCDGRRLLDAETTPGIDALDVVRLDSPRPPLVRLRYRVGGATSYRNDGVELFVVRDSALRLAWSASTLEGYYGGERPRQDSATIVIAPDGAITRTVWHPDGRVRLREHFRWDRPSATFVRTRRE